MALPAGTPIQLQSVVKPNEEEPWTKLIHDVLISYLQSSTQNRNERSAAEAIRGQAPQFTEGLPEGSDAHEPFFRRFWDIFVLLAQQIPYEHDGQKKAFRLLQVLDRGDDLPAEDKLNNIWKGFPFFRQCLQDEWDGKSMIQAACSLHKLRVADRS